jgi:hypothetical protein
MKKQGKSNIRVDPLISLPKTKTRRSHVDCKAGESPFTDHSCFKKISKEHKEASIEATKDNNPYYPACKLISLYFLGFNVINVFPENGARLSSERREVMKDIVRPVLMGTEIIADSAGGITLQVLINLLELPVNSTFKRMLLVVKSMHGDAILSLRENNIELAKEIVKSDDEVDRF